MAKKAKKAKPREPRTKKDQKPKTIAEVRAERKKGRDPKHEAAEGFDPAQYPLLSTINRALVADGVVQEADAKKRGAPKAAFDISKIMELLVQYGPLIAALIASFQKKKDPVVPVPAPVTPPLVPHPTDTPDLVPPVPQPPPVSVRRIARGKSRIIGVEGWRGKLHSHYSLGGGTVQNIIRGTEFCGAGYRIHLDSTPVDRNGVPFYNSDLPKLPHLFAQDPSQVVQNKFGAWTCGEGNNRINHYVTVDGVEYGPMGDLVPGMAWQDQDVIDLTSEYDDAACTPVLVVPQDIELGQEHTVSYRAVYVAPDGTEVAFEPSQQWKVKAWGH